AGVVIDAADGTVVVGNFIGLNTSGVAPVGNETGIRVYDGANGTKIGGRKGAGNVISGNTTGVEIAGLGTANNVVEGNSVGTDKLGTYAIGNSTGVYLESSSTNTIGGTAPGAGNLISGNLDGVTV